MSEETSLPPKKRSRLPALLGLGLLGAGLAWGARSWVPVKVADLPKAEIESFVLTAKASGTIKSIVVNPQAGVHEGLPIAYLDDAAEQKEYEAAQAALQKAASTANTEDIAVALPAETRVMGVIVPSFQAPPRGADTRIPTPRGPVTQLPPVTGAGETMLPAGGEDEEPTDTEPAPPGGPTKAEIQAEITEADAQIARFTSQRENAQAALGEAERAATTGQLTIQQGKQKVDRYRLMLQQGAVAANEVSRVEMEQRMAESAHQAVLDKKKAAEEELRTAERELNEATERKRDLTRDLASAPTAAPRAAPRTVRREPRQAPVRLPAAPRPRGVIGIRTAPPPAIPTRVDIDLTRKIQIDQALQVARARVDLAEEKLLARRITASRGMKVLEILVKPGQKVTAGMPILRFVPDEKLDAPPPPDIFEIWVNQVRALLPA